MRLLLAREQFSADLSWEALAARLPGGQLATCPPDAIAEHLDGTDVVCPLGVPVDAVTVRWADGDAPRWAVNARRSAGPGPSRQLAVAAVGRCRGVAAVGRHLLKARSWTVPARADLLNGSDRPGPH